MLLCYLLRLWYCKGAECCRRRLQLAATRNLRRVNLARRVQLLLHRHRMVHNCQ